METATSQTLHFDLSPSVTGFEPKVLDQPKAGDTIKVTGFHLDQVAEIHLKVDAAKEPAILTIASSPVRTDKTFTMVITDLDKLGTAKGAARVSFVLNDAKATEELLPVALDYTPSAAPPLAPLKRKKKVAPVKAH